MLFNNFLITHNLDDLHEHKRKIIQVPVRLYYQDVKIRNT